MVKKRNSFINKIKLSVINFYNQCKSYTKTINHFGINKNNIKRWIRKRFFYKKEEENADKNRKLTKFKYLKRIRLQNSTKLGTKIENQIFKFIFKKRDNNEIVTNIMIKNEAIALTSDSSFKASDSWLKRYKKRHNLSLRRKSNSQEITNEELIEKKQMLDERIQMSLNDKDGSDIKYIANMDQTMLKLDYSKTKTIDIKGSSTVSIKQQKFKYKPCTIVLCCSNIGYMFKTLICFKEVSGKLSDRVINKLTIPNNIEITASKSGWTTKEQMKLWFTDIWGQSNGKDNHLLILDSYSCHTSSETYSSICETKSKVQFLPGKTTPYFQPLDLTINNIFKNIIKKEYLNIQTDLINYRQLIINLVNKGLNEIKTDHIKIGFAKSGLNQYIS